MFFVVVPIYAFVCLFSGSRVSLLVLVALDNTVELLRDNIVRPKENVVHNVYVCVRNIVCLN